ncbi:MAG: class I SAM-dependent methyltransferase [Chlorobi bacterium]|nr:class I SAM-dependent methyltransferase [Chlorobiota bacterium]
MKYDPIKRSLGNVFNKTPFLRIMFYKMLDVLLLRAWHIRKDLKQWAKTAPSDAAILDAGSGFGQYDYYMSQLGKEWTVKGVDVKQEQIDDCNAFFTKAKLNNRVKFEFCDLTKLDEKEKYDLILSVDVMEHIEGDEKVFENFYKAMKPGGMLLISTPSDQGGSDAHHHDHDHEEGATGFIDEHVRDGYGVEDITQKLKRAGFKDVVAEYTYGRPGSLAWKLTMKYPILMLNASKLFFIILPLYYILVMPFALVLNYFDVKLKHKTGTGLKVKAFK